MSVDLQSSLSQAFSTWRISTYIQSQVRQRLGVEMLWGLSGRVILCNPGCSQAPKRLHPQPLPPRPAR